MEDIPLGDARRAVSLCLTHDNVWQIMYIMHDPMLFSEGLPVH